MNSSESNHDKNQLGDTRKDQVAININDHESLDTKKRSESLKLPRDTSEPIVDHTRRVSSFIDTSRQQLLDNSSSLRNAQWASVRLEKMGVKIEPEVVAKIVMSDPHQQSRDVIIETILQNEFGKVNQPKEEEEKSVRDFRLNSESMIEIDGSFYSPSYFNIPLQTIQQHQEQNKKCSVCKKQFETDLDNRKIFSCQDKFCHSCLLEKFGKRIKDGDDIETFVCPHASCSRPVVVDKFAKFVPEIDFKDLGDVEIGTCSICFEDIKGTENLLKIFECQTHLFCYDCTLNYLKESINNRKVLNVKCPDSNCESFLDENKMRDLIPGYLFSRYKRYKRNAMVERDPDLRWCARPGCDKVVNGTKDNPQAHCECGQVTCIGCGNPWHNNKTCEEVLEEEYKLFIKQKGIHFCPECKSKVEKSQGCNHMTCPICTYEWCWLCGGECPSNHFDIFNPFGCPGLRDEENSKKNWSRRKLTTYRCACIVLMIVFAPLAAIVAAILAPNIIFEQWVIESNGLKKFFRVTLLVIIGVILSPLTIAVGAVGAIAPGTCCLVIWLQERRKIRQEAKTRRRGIILSRLGKAPVVENLEDLEEKRKMEDFKNRLILSQPLLGDISGGIYIP